MFWFLLLLSFDAAPGFAIRRKARRFPGRDLKQPLLVIETLEDRCLLSGGITAFPIPTPGSYPEYITAGPNDNLWFTEIGDSAQHFGSVTPDGRTIQEFPVSSPGRPYAITPGPDNNSIWFTQYTDEMIVQATLGGQVSQRVPIPTPHVSPGSMVVGPDNNLWFVEDLVGKIGRVNLNHDPVDITEFSPDPYTSSRISFITVGPDGNLWFSEYVNGSAIGRVNLNHDPIDITVFPLTTSPTGAEDIVAGPDGNLWFANPTANTIGRISPDGTFLPEIPVPTRNSFPYGITVGPDGNMWFNELNGNQLGEIVLNDSLSVREFPIPTPNSSPESPIITGPDGNLWFTETRGNNIAKFYVLTATGLDLGQAVNAGQELDAVVANFHDDEPGMVGSNYQVDIDWGDGTSGGQAWTAGGGNWVATGSHTYADPGHYDITVTISDTHAPTGMTATAYSSIDVDPAAGSGNAGRRAGFEAFADVEAALATTPRLATDLAILSPSAPVARPITRRADEAPAQPLAPRFESDSLAAALATVRHDTGATAWAEAPAWLDLAAPDLLAEN